jgi:hypothetical protein
MNLAISGALTRRSVCRFNSLRMVFATASDDKFGFNLLFMRLVDNQRFDNC